MKIMAGTNDSPEQMAERLGLTIQYALIDFDIHDPTLQIIGGDPVDLSEIPHEPVNKPARSWVDSDIDRATVEIAEMARKFMRMESLAHVKGRPDRRHSLAVTVGIGGMPVTAHREFDVTDPDRPEVEALVAEVQRALTLRGESETDVVLAALAEISAAYIEQSEDKNSGQDRNLGGGELT